MTNSERYRFDTIGFSVLKSIITKKLIDDAIEKIDQELYGLKSIYMSIVGDSKVLRSSKRQRRLNVLLFRNNEFNNTIHSFLRHDHVDKYLERFI